MATGDILRLRPLFHELLAAELPRPTFIKVHDACIRTAAGPLFPRAATAAAIYLVRNPLDVAPSYAHHLQWSVDRTVAELNSPADRTSRPARLAPAIPDAMLSWSEHVSSWLESELPVHVARYEDMLADPTATFGAIISTPASSGTLRAWRRPSTPPTLTGCVARNRTKSSTRGNRPHRRSSGPGRLAPGGPC